MKNNCISVKNFEDPRTIYSASERVEIFMSADTDDAIDTIFDTTLGISTGNRNNSGNGS